MDFIQGKAKCYQFLIFLLVSSFTSITFAFETETSKSFFWAPQWVTTLSAGPVWASPGRSQSLTLAPGIQKTYVANHSSYAMPEVDLFWGLQQSLFKTSRLQFGLDVAVVGETQLSGDIWDDENINFNNYIYQYQISHTHLNLKAKWLFDFGYLVIPWISAGGGLAFNRAHDFSNNPNLYEAVVNPNFASKTLTGFNYTLGFGVQAAVNRNWQVGLGYEFADWGHSQLGPANGQPAGNGLYLAHTYTNGLLLNLTYLS